ncbi:MAG: nucleotidyltransferase domain-containing protein [Candidatus Cloacimonadota bacterium]|nr:MAG: nucleotidyltransferase domain-containing protein [Candidatus Cloacimonadota bacterium]
MKKSSETYYNRILKNIKTFVLEVFKDEDVKIILFGSGARGDFHRCSDIDIGIVPKNKYDKRKLILLRENLEEMNMPYKVDVVDISKVSKTFKDKALKEGEIWKN